LAGIFGLTGRILDKKQHETKKTTVASVGVQREIMEIKETSRFWGAAILRFGRRAKGIEHHRKMMHGFIMA